MASRDHGRSAAGPPEKGLAFLIYGTAALVIDSLLLLPFGYVPLASFRSAIAGSGHPYPALPPGWLPHISSLDLAKAALICALPLAVMVCILSSLAFFWGRAIGGRWRLPARLLLGGLCLALPLAFYGHYALGLGMMIGVCAANLLLFHLLFEKACRLQKADWCKFVWLALVISGVWLGAWLSLFWIAGSDAPLDYLLSLRDLAHDGHFVWMGRFHDGYYFFSPFVNLALQSTGDPASALPALWLAVLRLAALAGIAIGGALGVPMALAGIGFAMGALPAAVRRSDSSWVGVLRGGAVSCLACLATYLVALPLVVAMALSLAHHVGRPSWGEENTGAVRLYLSARALASSGRQPLSNDQVAALKAAALAHGSNSVRYWAMKACAAQRVQGWEDVVASALADRSAVVRANAWRWLPRNDPHGVKRARKMAEDPLAHPYVRSLCLDYLRRSKVLTLKQRPGAARTTRPGRIPGGNTTPP